MRGSGARQADTSFGCHSRAVEVDRGARAFAWGDTERTPSACTSAVETVESGPCKSEPDDGRSPRGTSERRRGGGVATTRSALRCGVYLARDDVSAGPRLPCHMRVAQWGRALADSRGGLLSCGAPGFALALRTYTRASPVDDGSDDGDDERSLDTRRGTRGCGTRAVNHTTHVDDTRWVAVASEGKKRVPPRGDYWACERARAPDERTEPSRTGRSNAEERREERRRARERAVRETAGETLLSLNPWLLLRVPLVTPPDRRWKVGRSAGVWGRACRCVCVCRARGQSRRAAEGICVVCVSSSLSPTKKHQGYSEPRAHGQERTERAWRAAPSAVLDPAPSAVVRQLSISAALRRGVGGASTRPSSPANAPPGHAHIPTNCPRSQRCDGETANHGILRHRYTTTNETADGRRRPDETDDDAVFLGDGKLCSVSETLQKETLQSEFSLLPRLDPGQTLTLPDFYCRQSKHSDTELFCENLHLKELLCVRKFCWCTLCRY